MPWKYFVDSVVSVVMSLSCIRVYCIAVCVLFFFPTSSLFAGLCMTVFIGRVHVDSCPNLEPSSE